MQSSIKKGSVSLHLSGEEVILSSGRGLFIPTSKTLIVADMHLGKSALFRQNGIPVPNTLIENDLARLSEMIAEFQPEKLVVAGDMFHQDINSEIDVFSEWRSTLEKMDIILVKGNHDKLPAQVYNDLDIEIVPKVLKLAAFQIVHNHADAHEDIFSISGHVHPGVALRGKAKQGLRMPCFRVGKDHIILPAFSAFTGLDVSKCEERCRYFAIAGNEIHEVPF